MKKIIMFLTVILFAVMSASAVSYNGFEVRNGYGDVEVIDLEFTTDYSDQDSDTESIEMPLFYYKALESQLEIVDEYMSLTEEELRTADMSKLNEAFSNLEDIIYYEPGFLSEEELETFFFWDEKMWEKWNEDKEAQKPVANTYSEDFDNYISNIKSVLKKIGNIITYVKNGFYTWNYLRNNLTMEGRNSFGILLQAFPSIELSNLGIEI